VKTPWYIAHADPSEAGAAVEILREVSQWLHDLGKPLWPLDAFDVDAYREAAAAKQLILGYDISGPVAAMLLQQNDDVYWPQAKPGEALYVHKVAVRRAAAGQRWSARLIAWARTEARLHGAQFLRLDTANRRALLSLYQNLGFRIVDAEPQAVGNLSVYRLELRVAARMR